MPVNKTNDVDKYVGEFLYTERLKRGWSRKKTVDMLDNCVTHQQWAKYEKGANRFPIALFLVVAKLFDFRPGEILDSLIGVDKLKIEDVKMDKGILDIARLAQKLPDEERKAVMRIMRIGVKRATDKEHLSEG